jgi:PPP family 3-phenylpropionic acid transporter
LWGSVGFIAASWLGGATFERIGYQAVPTLTVTLVGLTLIATLLIRPLDQASDKHAQGAGFGKAVASRAAIVALASAALIAVSFGAYYVFFSLYLAAHGYSKQAIGLLWALGVIAEVVVFAAGSSLLRRFTIRNLFVAAALGTCIRWWMTALWVAQPVAIACAQLLHCLGFAVLHFAIVLSAQRLFPAGLASRGQALFSSVGYGFGGMAGSLLAGVIWVGFSPRASYVSAAFIVVLAAVLAFVGLRGTVLDSQPSSPAA